MERERERVDDGRNGQLAGRMAQRMKEREKPWSKKGTA